jgi:hypothetical protein
MWLHPHLLRHLSQLPLTSLTLRACNLAPEVDHEGSQYGCDCNLCGRGWWQVRWNRPRLAGIMSELGEQLAGLRPSKPDVLPARPGLQHLNTGLEKVLSAWQQLLCGTKGATAHDGDDLLRAADMQPLVDGAVSLRGSLRSVAISVRAGGRRRRAC